MGIARRRGACENEKVSQTSKITFLFLINNDHFNAMYLNTSLCLTLNISYHIIFLCVCCLVVLGASAMRCETRMIGMLRGLHSEVLTALSVRLLLSLARSRSPPLSPSSFAFSLSLSLYLSPSLSYTHPPSSQSQCSAALDGRGCNAGEARACIYRRRGALRYAACTLCSSLNV